MKKLLQISTAAALLFISQNAFSQAKESVSQENNLNIKAKSITRNLKEKTIVYDSEVSLNSKFIAFDNAEKVVMDENSSTLKIYNCKNLKFIELKTLTKPAKKENDYITYDYKENTVIL
jgi:hypothetical protein